MACSGYAKAVRMPRDVNVLAHKTLQIAIGEDIEPEPQAPAKDPVQTEPVPPSAMAGLPRVPVEGGTDRN